MIYSTDLIVSSRTFDSNMCHPHHMQQKKIAKLDKLSGSPTSNKSNSRSLEISETTGILNCHYRNLVMDVITIQKEHVSFRS